MDFSGEVHTARAQIVARMLKGIFLTVAGEVAATAFLPHLAAIAIGGLPMLLS